MKANTERERNATPLLLRISDVTAETGYGRTTVYALVASGELPVVRCGRALRVPRAALEAWIERKQKGA